MITINLKRGVFQNCMYFKILIFKFMSELFECRRCKYKSIKYPYKANNSNNKLFVWRDLNDKDSFKKSNKI